MLLRGEAGASWMDEALQGAMVYKAGEALQAEPLPQILWSAEAVQHDSILPVVWLQEYLPGGAYKN